LRRSRRNHSLTFKAKVRLAALKGEKTLAELAQLHDAHMTQIAAWKTQLLEGAAGVLVERDPRSARDTLFGEGLRSMSLDRRRELIDRAHPALSIVCQCELMSITRSGLYHQPVGERRHDAAARRGAACVRGGGCAHGWPACAIPIVVDAAQSSDRCRWHRRRTRSRRSMPSCCPAVRPSGSALRVVCGRCCAGRGIAIRDVRVARPVRSTRNTLATKFQAMFTRSALKSSFLILRMP
jgi:transposase-like protein